MAREAPFQLPSARDASPIAVSTDEDALLISPLNRTGGHMRHTSILIFAAGLLGGCNDQGFRNATALLFVETCKRDSQPSPELAKENERQCSCIADRIRNSDITASESEASSDAKIQRAVALCIPKTDGEE